MLSSLWPWLPSVCNELLLTALLTLLPPFPLITSCTVNRLTKYKNLLNVSQLLIVHLIWSKKYVLSRLGTAIAGPAYCFGDETHSMPLGIAAASAAAARNTSGLYHRLSLRSTKSKQHMLISSKPSRMTMRNPLSPPSSPTSRQFLKHHFPTQEILNHPSSSSKACSPR